MTTHRVARRAVVIASLLGLPALLAGCGEPAGPVTFPPLGWTYLSPIKLDVAGLEIDDSWTPRGGARERGYLAPTPPLDALRQMARDRLITGGSSGRAVFVIDDASIQQVQGSYVGSFAVHLEVSTADGTRAGFAEARVSRQRAIRDASPSGVRAELFDMVKQMMADMNVEFEFRVQRALRDYLQTTAPAAPPPGPVEQEDLTPPAAPALPPEDVPGALPGPAPLND